MKVSQISVEIMTICHIQRSLRSKKICISFETGAFVSTDGTTLSPPLWTEAQMFYFAYNRGYLEHGSITKKKKERNELRDSNVAELLCTAQTPMLKCL